MPPITKDTNQALDHMVRDPQSITAHTAKKSKFVRIAGLLMPLIAVILVAMVFLWNTINKEIIIPIDNSELTIQSIGKNELINPKFESRDNKDQPFTITADRAYQQKSDEDKVRLDNPSGEVTLTTNEHVAISATSGEFSQDTQELILRENVKLAHSSGYTLDTTLLYIDLKNSQAGTDAKVTIETQDGTIEAAGLRAHQTQGTLKFIGPAKITLKNGIPKDFQ